MAFDELFDWTNSQNRPTWQKDALRRLAIAGDLTDDDLRSLLEIIRHEVGLAEGQFPVAVPLASEHLVDASLDAPRTILSSIGPVRGIDRLASDQPPIKFAKRGITLVYGANGSGKSGYCRIAKQLCRSVSPQELKADVYSASPTNPPEVDLVYGFEGTKPERRNVTWKFGDPAPQELARISVFDTETARVYVDKNRKVEFLPYELDLLNKLALSAKALDGVFEDRENALNAAIKTPLPSGYHENTAIAELIAKLSPDTAAANLPTEDEIRVLAEWDAVKESVLLSVSTKINDDPAARLLTFKAAKSAIENVRTELLECIALLGDEGFSKLVVAYKEKVAKTEAATVAARGLGEGHPIPDIGSDAWRQMLLYAREFAGEAFPHHTDPKLASADFCVLCQQPLNDGALRRMSEFDQYITGRTARASEEASVIFSDLVARIEALQIRPANQVRDLLSVFAATSNEREILAEQIAEVFLSLAVRKDNILGEIEAGNFDGTTNLQALPTNIVSKIDANLNALKDDVSELEKAGNIIDEIDALRAKKANLENAKRLSQEIDIVVERLQRLIERLKVIEARKQCASGPIARQLTTRRRALLTDSLKSQLIAELKMLKLSHIPLELFDRSTGSESIVEIGLTARQRIRNNSSVLSEGEQRALALSCFFAELKEVGSEHGIIVDDPVSSLDHSRMDAVAKRLVIEASAGRQVIIFTHNIVFHHMVENECRIAGIPFHSEWMSSVGGTKFGVVDESGKPPHTKKTKQRINDLQQDTSALFKSGYDPERTNDFRDAVTAIYTRMRETWEQMVEEIIFNGSIQRFRGEVMTQSLEAAAFDPLKDYPEIFEGMKRCSHFSGHDRADSLPDGLPDQNAIESDLASLIRFRDRVVARKNQLERGSKYEKGVKPEFL
ncbi:MAG: AAA family ATPase [Parvibaculum sp.]|nr:AAA family ATPase [Parvibaculum sp.]